MQSAIPMAGPRVVGQAAYDEARRLHKLTAGGTVGSRVHGLIPGMPGYGDILVAEPVEVPKGKTLGEVTVVEGLAMIRSAPDASLADMKASEEGRNGGARKTLLDALAHRMKA